MCQKTVGFCNDKMCQNCYNRSFASHPKSKYWSVQNEIEPRFVSKNSHKKYEFDCPCGHTFGAILCNISRGSWCPYCCNPPLKLCMDTNCKNCFDKSFAFHDKSKFWSDENELSPRAILKNSGKKFKFDCDICEHTFESSLNDINRGSWCGYCFGRKLCTDSDCNHCFNKSFASHPRSAFMADKYFNPRQIAKYCNQKYKFNCECGHSFESVVNNISNNSWCPYCCNPPLRLCENINCIQCYYKSFFSHPKSQFWSAHNKLESRFVFRNCATPFIFVCEKKHIFSTRPSCIVSDNTWCPFCKNKTEAKLYKWLQDNYSNVAYQKKYSWCKKINRLPFDFVLEEMKIIIELDGAQHFRQISNWDNPENIQNRDIYKMRHALKHGYSVIRIIQENVWEDNYDWKSVLSNSIKKYNNPKCIYLSKRNEYECYKSKLN